MTEGEAGTLDQAAPGKRAPQGGDGELHADRQIDHEVEQRSPSAVELPIEAPHRAVEGDVVAEAAVPRPAPLEHRGPPLHVKHRDASVVPDLPALAMEAEAP